MIDKDKVLQAIQAFRAAIRVDEIERLNPTLNDQERSLIRANFELCTVEMVEAIKRLPFADPGLARRPF